MSVGLGHAECASSAAASLVKAPQPFYLTYLPAVRNDARWDGAVVMTAGSRRPALPLTLSLPASSARDPDPVSEGHQGLAVRTHVRHRRVPLLVLAEGEDDAVANGPLHFPVQEKGEGLCRTSADQCRSVPVSAR